MKTWLTDTGFNDDNSGDEGWIDGEWQEITAENADDVDGYDEDDYPY